MLLRELFVSELLVTELALFALSTLTRSYFMKPDPAVFLRSNGAFDCTDICFCDC